MYVMPHTRILYSALLFFVSLVLFAQNPSTAVFPNLIFPDGKSLKDYTTTGVVLVYGDSSCPACQKAQGQLELRHQKWSAWGYPIVYIALDSDAKNLKQNFGTPPWPVYCDGKSWDSPWVAAADLRGTPTFFALDPQLKIKYEATNVAQMDLWLRTQTSHR